MVGRDNRKLFPVAVVVPNVYLKRIEYKQAEKNGRKYEYISLSFYREGAWLNASLFNPVQKYYEKYDMYHNARIRLRRNLEHIASALLNTDEMIELFQGKDYKTFGDFAENYVRTIQDKCTHVSLDIKTVYTKGQPALPASPHFIRRHGDTYLQFKYTEKELEKMRTENFEFRN